MFDDDSNDVASHPIENLIESSVKFRLGNSKHAGARKQNKVAWIIKHK